VETRAYPIFILYSHSFISGRLIDEFVYSYCGKNNHFIKTKYSSEKRTFVSSHYLGILWDLGERRTKDYPKWMNGNGNDTCAIYHMMIGSSYE
jgi:hypothetical protein